MTLNVSTFYDFKIDKICIWTELQYNNVQYNLQVKIVVRLLLFNTAIVFFFLSFFFVHCLSNEKSILKHVFIIHDLIKADL